MLTLESKTMHSTETLTDHGFSSISDNILMLRYVDADGELRPSLAVVKTRGSAHAFGHFAYTLGVGGIRVGDGRRGARRPESRRPERRRAGRTAPAAVGARSTGLPSKKTARQRTRGKR